MTKYIGRYWLLVSVVILVAAGCMRSGSDTDLQAPISRDLPTSTPFPTETPIPPPTELPEEEAEVFAPAVAQQPEDFTEDDPFDGILQQEVPTPTLSEFLIQATEIIAQATQQALDQTATAEGPAVELPTFTPTMDPLFEQPTATPAPIVSGADCVHEVRAGENLFRLSLRYGVLVMDIARASGVTNVDRISVGQRLTIPGCGTTGQVPPPTSVPTPGTGTGDTTTPPGAGGVRHTVQQGETLFQISLRYGVPVNTIAAANGISNINLIYLNQELVIP
jgi:LysM repeat protein